MVLIRILIVGMLIMILALSVYAQNDTLTTFSFKDYLDIVKLHHPLAKQADLQPEKGRAAIQNARGGFDPKLYNSFNQKQFEDKEYYSLLDAGVKIPTWLGLELYSGFEQNNGVFLNPENNTPNSGLWYGGIMVPVGQGLLIDKRRAMLRQAEIYQKSSLEERNQLLNELIFQAGSAYWDWFKAFHIKVVYEEALEVATQRFEAVKRGALLGDSPFIDTLEAGIQVQTRKIGLQQAELELQNSVALLSVFLWTDGSIPLQLNQDISPSEFENISFSNTDEDLLVNFDEYITTHPELAIGQFKIDQLMVENRMKKEMLKPTLNLKYNALYHAQASDALSPVTNNNYNWGVEFSFPLLLRKERGELKTNQLKVQESQLDLSNKIELLAFKAQAAVNEWDNSNIQAIQLTQTVNDYFGLLRGEQQLFESGESSLFLVNSRELSYINARIKLVEITSKNQIAELKTKYALGILNQ